MVLPKYIIGHASLRSVKTRETRQYHVKTGPIRLTSSMRSRRQRAFGIRAARDRHSLSSIRSCDGNVPCRRSCLDHHVDRQMVERCIFALHPKAGRAVFPSRCKTDAHFLFVSGSPRHRPSSRLARRRRSSAAQPSRQRRDTEKYWKGRVLTGAATDLFALQLIVYQMT